MKLNFKSTDAEIVKRIIENIKNKIGFISIDTIKKCMIKADGDIELMYELLNKYKTVLSSKEEPVRREMIQSNYDTHMADNWWG
jgi:hypothetical protein